MSFGPSVLNDVNRTVPDAAQLMSMEDWLANRIDVCNAS